MYSIKYFDTKFLIRMAQSSQEKVFHPSRKSDPSWQDAGGGKTLEPERAETMNRDLGKGIDYILSRKLVKEVAIF